MKSITAYLNLNFISLLLSVLLMATAEAKVMAQVKQLFAQTDEHSVTLHWALNATQSVAAIRIYRKAYAIPMQEQVSSDQGELLVQLKPQQTEYVDTEVKAGFYYYYRLVLLDEQQNQSKASAPAIAILKDKTPPDTPQVVALSSINKKQFQIEWQASKANDVVAYRLYRATLQGTPRLIRMIDAQPTVKGFYKQTLAFQGNPNFEYRYFVAAVDGSGNESKLSKARRLRMPDDIPPRAPLLLQAKQQGQQILLSWQANRENDLQGYKLYRKTKQGEFKPLHKKLLTQTQFTDRSVQGLSRYGYRVAAVDRYGNESAATRGIEVRTTRFNNSLEAPALLRLKANRQQQPTLSWRTVPQAQGYLVQRSDGTEFQTLSGLLQTTHFIDETIKPNIAYRYRVVAVNRLGTLSAPSRAVLWQGGQR